MKIKTNITGILFAAVSITDLMRKGAQSPA